ncbi:MAG: PfkB family carbohydrate kinase [Nocardioidaceae bacterium]
MSGLGGCPWSGIRIHGALTPIPGAQLVTPNRGEAKTFGENAGIGTASAGLAAVAADASGLAKAWQARAVAVTMGSRGALLAYAEGAPCVTPAPAVDCIDSCGAGDRFAVSAAVALASGLVTTEAVQAAVQDATTYVAQGGPGTLSTTLTGAARAAASLPQEQADREPDGVEVALARCAVPVVSSWRPADVSTCCTLATSPPCKQLADWVSV